MAENCVKINKRNKKMLKNNRNKRFVRFQHSFDTCLERDVHLSRVRRRVETGRQLWRQLFNDSTDEEMTERNSFEGFSDKREKKSREMSPKVMQTSGETEPEMEAKAEVIDQRIRKLLRSQWEDRIRQTLGEREAQRSASAAEMRRNATTSLKNNILRKARLEINTRTLLKIRRAQRLEQQLRSEEDQSCPAVRRETTAQESKSGQPGFITCAICNATKYYSHVQRRYGVFSCEPCSKFFARFIKEPKQYFCSNSGDCPISESQSVDSTAGRVRRQRALERCRACWLKVCLQKFSIQTEVRHSIAQGFWPKLVTEPQVALITVDTSMTSSSKPMASRALHNPTDRWTESLLMVASNGPPERSQRCGHNNGPRVKRVCRSAGLVSGLPRATFADDRGRQSDADSDELPVDVYLCRKKSPKKTKLFRCKDCEGCRADDCGQCNHCRDKKKFGGRSVIKQACRYRTCSNLRPHSEHQNNRRAIVCVD